MIWVETYSVGLLATYSSRNSTLKIDSVRPDPSDMNSSFADSSKCNAMA